MTERDDALKELGRIVTERRENAGMTLEAVFDKTRIRPEYLRGIEEGDYTDFPEPVYVKGFIRTYLKVIGAEDLIEDFYARLSHGEHSQPSAKKENAGRSVANVLGNGTSAPEGFKPVSHFWLFFVLIAALAGTGTYVWYAVNNGGLDFKNLKLFNFNNHGAINSGISSNDIDVSVTEIIEDVVISDDPGTSEIEEEEPEPEPEIKPSLEIHAINDVWLSVSFGNAQPSYKRTLKRGESMRWDLGEPAKVVIGRPTSAQIILNGKDLGVPNPKAKKAETYIYNADGTFSKIK